MKGTIHKSIEKLVIAKFGIEKWQECLKSIGLDEDHVFMLSDDVDEKLTMELLGKMPAILGITFGQLVDAFGQNWVNEYIPKVYPAYLEKYKTAKDLLLGLDSIHVSVTEDMANAHPPRFSYKWKDEATLLMTYTSHRGLIDVFVACIKGVGTYYKQPLEVTKQSENVVEIKFS